MKKVGWIFDDYFLRRWSKDSSLWLLGIFAGLVGIHVSLVLDANDGSLAGSSLLYWIAIGSMLWARRDTLKLTSGPVSTTIGMVVMTLVLIKSAFIRGYDPFLRISPILSCLGTGLLASGVLGLRQFWKEFSIIAFLAPPPSLLEKVIDTSPVTAKFSTALLWYSGFDVSRQKTFIFVPNGGVEVYSGCSGIDTMLHLLGLSIVFLAMFPTSKIQRFILPLVSVLIAFVINGIRVGVMAALSEPVNKSAFEYWHKGDGSLIFSMIAVMILGTYCFFILKPDGARSEDILSEPSESVELN